MKEYKFDTWQRLAGKGKVYEYDDLYEMEYSEVEPISLTKVNILCPRCSTFLYDVNFLPKKQYEPAIHMFHSYDTQVAVFCRLCGYRGYRRQGLLRKGEKRKRFERARKKANG